MKNTSELWLQVGTANSNKDMRRYIPVHEITKALSPTLLQILPAAHALTGCDTTSGIFGIGKKSVYKYLKSNTAKYKDLHTIGDADTETAVDLSRELVTSLYDQKGKALACHSDLNKLRVKLCNRKDSSLVRLPPCEEAFRQHVLRSSFQTKIWMTSCIAKPPIGSPLSHGWKEGKVGLEFVLFEGPMSSDFLQDLICVCKGRSVCSKECVCFTQNLSCTELCSCQGNEACCNGFTRFQETPDEEP